MTAFCFLYKCIHAAYSKKGYQYTHKDKYEINIFFKGVQLLVMHLDVKIIW